MRYVCDRKINYREDEEYAGCRQGCRLCLFLSEVEDSHDFPFSANIRKNRFLAKKYIRLVENIVIMRFSCLCLIGND